MERANVIFIAAAIYARTHTKHTYKHREKAIQNID